jgi:hypothetical protein
MTDSVFPTEMEWCNSCGYVPKIGVHICDSNPSKINN